MCDLGEKMGTLGRDYADEVLQILNELEIGTSLADPAISDLYLSQKPLEDFCKFGSNSVYELLWAWSRFKDNDEGYWSLTHPDRAAVRFMNAIDCYDKEMHEKQFNTWGDLLKKSEHDISNRKMGINWANLLLEIRKLREITVEERKLTGDLLINPIEEEIYSNKIRSLLEPITKGTGVIRIPNGNGEFNKARLDEIFEEHENAPLSNIYDLTKDYYSGIFEHTRIVFRENGVVTIIHRGKAILELLGGTWHPLLLLERRNSLLDVIDDLTSDKTIVKIAKIYFRSLLNLAYHLAIHNHGAILVLGTFDKEILYEPNPWESIKNVWDHHNSPENVGLPPDPRIKRKMQVDDDGIRIGFGRLLYSFAAQDGLTWFDENGSLSCFGQFVKKVKDEEGDDGGARTKAARACSKDNKIAIKVSQDGQIDFFFNERKIARIRGGSFPQIKPQY